MDDNRILELLAALIDEISKKDTVVSVSATQQDIQSDHETETETALDGDNFVPPLQQHLEILKKMAGIPQKSEDSLSPNNEVDDKRGPIIW